MAPPCTRGFTDADAAPSAGRLGLLRARVGSPKTGYAPHTTWLGSSAHERVHPDVAWAVDPGLRARAGSRVVQLIWRSDSATR